ncbi:hypothetical protein NZK32_15810 [Cyanobium sp. FGCU-52]|nr:hypothetical protein [Cyanobium sp. FGCU52]
MGEAPSRRQISGERFGLHDQADQAMLAAARLAMDLALPTEEAGPHALLDPQRCVHWLRRLYERALGEPLDNERPGRAPGLDLSLMNSSNADQVSISLISPLCKLNLARLGRFLPRMGTPRPQSCPA